MAKFPTSVAVTDDLLDAKNNVQTLADGAHDAVVTTITVDDTSSFPTAGRATFNDASLEVFSYTGKTATTFTGVTRGVDGTSAASHLDNAVVAIFQSAKYHNVLNEEIIAIAQNLSDRIGLGATQLKVPNGSAGTPPISFANSTTTGLFRAAADQIGISIAGTEVGRFGANGLMLGNASAPSTLLHLDEATHSVSQITLKSALAGSSGGSPAAGDAVIQAGAIDDIADDGTAELYNGAATQSVTLILNFWNNSTGAATSAIINGEADASPSTPTILAQGGEITIDTSTADVTGTTGSDGQCRVSFRNGIIEFENRAGAAVRMRYFILR